MSRTRRRSRFLAAQHAPAQDRWLFSYADFVTLLFAVFVVLFAFSWKRKQPIGNFSSAVHQGFDAMSANPSRQTSASGTTNAPPPAPPVTDAHTFGQSELFHQLHGILGDAINRQEIVLQQTPDGLIISLRELGFFASGEAQLKPGADAKLTEAARVLQQHGLEIRVEGHSDDQPIHSALFQSNWELSVARAMNVLKLLVEDANFPPSKISAAGYGPFRPVASNETPEGRQQNRRVDLVVLAPRSSPVPIP
jgi:chemotaxis protein MotB